MPCAIGCKNCELIFQVNHTDSIEDGIALRCPYCGAVERYTDADIIRAKSTAAGSIQ